MSQKSEIFDTHYHDYLDKIGRADHESVREILAIESEGDIFQVPLMETLYRVSAEGIFNPEGKRPAYGICVILAKYILNCPDTVHQDLQWVSFRDFRQTSHFTNVNYFASDTEQAITKHFSGRLADLEKACEITGGIREETEMPYDLAVSFRILPRISQLLLFNDRDEEFPAQCKVLFHRHSEFYLDPESLAMTGAVLAKTLTAQTLKE